jgi:hypothetical protein
MAWKLSQVLWELFGHRGVRVGARSGVGETDVAYIDLENGEAGRTLFAINSLLTSRSEPCTAKLERHP